MTREEVSKKVLWFLSDHYGFPLHELEESKTFVNDLGMDSLDSVEFLMEMEKEFNIAIPDEQAEEHLNDTIGKAIDYLTITIKKFHR